MASASAAAGAGPCRRGCRRGDTLRYHPVRLLACAGEGEAVPSRPDAPARVSTWGALDSGGTRAGGGDKQRRTRLGPAWGDAVSVGGNKERVRETETWLGRCTSSPG